VQSSRRLRTLTVLAAAVTATAVLGGCAAGFDATSTKPYAPADGVIASSGDLRVLNALVVGAEGANDGLVSMTVVNGGIRDDRVTGITTPSGSVTVSGDDQVPAGGSLTFGATGTTATVSGLDKAAGQEVALKVSFSRAEPVTLRTVVVAADEDYASLTPSPSPSPTPSPTETATESPSPSQS
jgi:copper(I)-binding protein